MIHSVLTVIEVPRYFFQVLFSWSAAKNWSSEKKEKKRFILWILLKSTFWGDCYSCFLNASVLNTKIMASFKASFSSNNHMSSCAFPWVLGYFLFNCGYPRMLILLMKEMLMSLNYSLKQSKVFTLAVGRLQPKSSINGLCFIDFQVPYIRTPAANVLDRKTR